MRHSPGAAGLDLGARLDTTIEPGAVGRIPANIVARVPAEHVLLVMLRSGTPGRTGLICPHGVGVIDADYCGPDDEIQVQVMNPTDRAVTVRRGDRIAQALLLPLAPIEWEEVDCGPEVSRGGFGSTG